MPVKLSSKRHELGGSMPLIVYGTTWCSDCMRAKLVLDEKQIPYQFIDIACDPAAAETVEKINGGNRSVPTILFPDGTVLVEPSNQQLIHALHELNITSRLSSL